MPLVSANMRHDCNNLSLTGLWLRDVATTAGGSHRYFGTDIVPDLFPSQLPRNMTLQEQDFTKPWPPSWRSSFDLVHQRLGLAGAGSCPLQVVVKNLVELAKPGGWLELVELDLDVADGQGPALRDFLRLLKELFTLGGMGGNFAVKLRGLLEEAGLENVEERVVEIPAGARNTNPNLAARSINGVCGALEPLIAVAKSKSRERGFSTLRKRRRTDSRKRDPHILYGRATCKPGSTHQRRIDKRWRLGTNRCGLGPETCRHEGLGSERKPTL